MLCSVRRGAGIWYVLECVRALADAPAWCERYYSRLCRSSICGSRMGQITGKASVKPRALFCGVGGIVCVNDAKHAINACMGLYCSRTK